MSLRDELGGPLLSVPDLEKLEQPRKQLEAVRGEKNASDARLTQLLRVELPAAEEADRLKFARRLSKDAAGAADPGDHAAQRVGEKIDGERRRFHALQIAEEELEDAIGDLIVRQRDEIVSAARKRAEDAVTAFAEATAEAERRHQEVIREEALIEWAEQFPGRKLGNFDGFVRAAAMRQGDRRPDPVPA